jgi:hypothetical protein
MKYAFFIKMGGKRWKASISKQQSLDLYPAIDKLMRLGDFTPTPTLSFAKLMDLIDGFIIIIQTALIDYYPNITRRELAELIDYESGKIITADIIKAISHFSDDDPPKSSSKLKLVE